MTTERVEIVFSARGGRGIKRQFDQIESSANRTARSVGLLRNLIRGFIGVQTIRGIINTADAYTQVQNRLRVVTDSTQELTGVTQKLFDISQRTRSSFEASAELYSRVALATREMGISAQETLDFTESLNQAVILSGASAQEAQAGLIQLSQGLASGTLRGDELRSVLEQLPVVADVIADSLGVTRGELRQLGTDGKITADIVIEAFKEAREELEEKFGKTVPTIAQSFQQLRNAVVKTIGEFTTGTGISSLFAQAIKFLADNFETLARAISAAAIAFGILAGPAAIGYVITQMNKLRLVFLSNPIGIVITAIALLIGYFVAFGDQIKVFGSDIVTVADVIKASFQVVGEIIIEVANIAAAVFGSITGEAQASADGVASAFGTLLRIIARVFDTFVGIVAGGVVAAFNAWQNFSSGVANAWEQLTTFLINKWRQFLNFFIGGYNAVASVIGGEQIELFDPKVAESQGVTFGEALSEGWRAGFDASTLASDTLDEIGNRSEAIAQQRIETAALQAEQAAALEELLNRSGERTSAAGGGGGKGGAKKLNEEMNRLKQLYEEVTGGADDLFQKQQDLAALFESGAISAQQFTMAMRDLNVEISALDNSFSGGIANGFDRIIARSNELGSQMSNFVVGAFDSATDAIVEFAKTGEFNVREFFGNLAAELLKIATNQLFAQLLSGFAGGGLGGGAGLLGGLFGFAEGGSAMVGGSGGTDSQLVAFKATPGERVNVETPAQQQRSDRGQMAPQIIQAPAPNVVVAIGDKDVAGALNSAAGDDAIVQGIERNARTIKSVLQT